MKNLIYVLIFGIFIISSSCQKDIEVVKPNNTLSTSGTKKGKSNLASVPEYSKQGGCSNDVYVENGMLVFIDVNHFKTTLECIEQQVQDYNQAFADQYSSLTDDQISDMMESTNFNEFQPLIDFESGFSGYKSLRNKVEGQMVKWLNKPDLDMSTYPRNVSVMGQGLRTLVNESYQVKIGNDIVDLSANNNGLSASFAPTSECGMFGYSQDKVAFDGGNKKLVTNCALTPALFGSIVGGEAYVYWKKNGSWKSYSTKINSHSTGRLLTINCDFDQDFNKFEDVRNRSFVNPVRRIWLRSAMMAHDYEILMSVELPNFNVYFEINADIWY